MERFYHHTKRIAGHLFRDIRRIYPALLAAAGYLLLMELLFHSTCFFVILFGFPCPGCGMTRAFFSLLRLDFEGVMENNISILAWIFLGVYLFWWYYGKEKEPPAKWLVIILVCIFTFFVYFWRFFSNNMAEITFPGIFRLVLNGVQ